MKAILVIDMPKTCSECPLSYFAYPDDFENDMMYCKVHEGYMEDAFNIRAVWCPLKPMPRPMPYEQTDTQTVKAVVVDNSFRLGWNACIDELEDE